MTNKKIFVEAYSSPTSKLIEFQPMDGILTTSSQLENYQELDFWTEVEE